MIVSDQALVWPAEDAGLAALPEISAEQIQEAELLASTWLWELTARRFGTRVTLDRPQTEQNRYLFRTLPNFLSTINGYMNGGWPYDGDPRTGQYGQRQVVELERDALSISQIVMWLAPGVTTDPAINPTTGVLDPTTYRLEGNYLVRQDGGSWPQTQNMISAVGRPDTWQITYVRGVTVPRGGQRAAGLLALEFGKAIIGKTGCKLPYNVTTATRNGVTISRDILTAQKITGIGDVDRWVAMQNPNGLMRPPTIWSPDTARNQRPYLGSYAGGSTTAL